MCALLCWPRTYIPTIFGHKCPALRIIFYTRWTKSLQYFFTTKLLCIYFLSSLMPDISNICFSIKLVFYHLGIPNIRVHQRYRGNEGQGLKRKWIGTRVRTGTRSSSSSKCTWIGMSASTSVRSKPWTLSRTMPNKN